MNHASRAASPSCRPRGRPPRATGKPVLGLAAVVCLLGSLQTAASAQVAPAASPSPALAAPPVLPGTSRPLPPGHPPIPDAGRAAPSAAATGGTAGPLREVGLDAVVLDIQGQLDPDDAGLMATLQLRFSTPEGTRHTIAEKSPLSLSLLVPSVRDIPVDRGLLPSATRHIETAAEGSLQVRIVAGSMVAWGTISADGRADVRVRYPIAWGHSSIDLGLRGVVGRTRVSVLVSGRAPGRARIESTWPVRPARLDEAGDRMVGLNTTRALRPGQRLIVRVSDLPSASTWPARTLSGLGLVFVGFAVVTLVASRRRRELASRAV